MTNDGIEPYQEQNQELEVDDNTSRIKLSVPWESSIYNMSCQSYICNENVSRFPASSNHSNVFITERTRLHETYIRQQAINKRIGMILSFILILSAALIVTFAPNDRQNISYWVGASLVVFAGGAVGFGRVWGKAANISFGADQDKREL